ncbi:MAG: FAD:protein FMN transferase [candidate division SR1 bacterium]|nr:FAD:protein FMN transferase [candidate division SR1 bacterium]
MQWQQTKHLMGTEVTITIFGDKDVHHDIDKVFQLFQDMETEFSRFQENSSLSKLNEDRTGMVSERFLEVLGLCKTLYTETGGYFNPLINVRQLGYSADFHSHAFKKEDLDLEINLDFETVEIVGNQVTLQQGQQLDLGGIVKGYAVDQAKNFLKSIGYTDFIIDAGGDIFCSGLTDTKQKIVVGIDSPFVSGNLFATLQLQDKAIATSGTYRRKRTIDQESFHHIINPLTSDNPSEIISISLIAEHCYFADAYATACIAMGLEKTLAFLKKQSIDGLIMCSDILNHQKNEGNEDILDDGVIPTTGETVSANEVKGLQISKAVRYKKVYMTSGMKGYEIQYV